jgi:hypothetical protein
MKNETKFKVRGFLHHEELVKAIALSTSSGSAMESMMVMLMPRRIPARLRRDVTWNPE